MAMVEEEVNNSNKASMLMANNKQFVRSKKRTSGKTAAEIRAEAKAITEYKQAIEKKRLSLEIEKLRAQLAKAAIDNDPMEDDDENDGSIGNSSPKKSKTSE